ncbi:hypothetical protein G7046_g6374 [Stylonectria norvegica]|nr:hypothetical protein G7046_g6374 [Stylonectria norvegica]
MISPKSLLVATALPVLALADILSSQTVAQNPLGSWLENVVVRPNGDLLATQLYQASEVFTNQKAEVFTIHNPYSGGHHTLEVAATIPAIQNLLGISQVGVVSGRETYVVVGGNSTSDTHPVVGAFSAWSLTYESAP